MAGRAHELVVLPVRIGEQHIEAVSLAGRDDAWEPLDECVELARDDLIPAQLDSRVSRPRSDGDPRSCCLATSRSLGCAERWSRHAIRSLSSEVVLEPDVDPVPQLSAVNLDSVENVAMGVLAERLGRLSDDRMRQLCEALEVAVDCGR